MENSFIKELRNAKENHNEKIVEFFNDGKVRRDKIDDLERLESAKLTNKFYMITDVMSKATELYGYTCDFDTITMKLYLGIIYDIDDIDENDQIKENASPMKGMLRFYTGEVDCYLDGEKTNERTSERGSQSYIKFSQLMSSVKKCGLDYNGPETFEELKTRILNNEVFDITLTASLKQKEEKLDQETVKEEKPVEQKPKTKRFFKR
ncbi:MAG: hypothetical protein IJI43_02020 [Bacilli bacterium]|nr:hypothetical protein [Bacilli bacterium]MBQ6538679.1 hypothetical protein [Bacilli bacterium]